MIVHIVKSNLGLQTDGRSPRLIKRNFIDQKLSFKEHDKINKAYKMLGLIKRNFKYLTTESFTTV